MSPSDSKARRELIVAYVRERRRVRLADVREWAVARFRYSRSTFYDDVAWLVAHNKLTSATSAVELPQTNIWRIR